MSGKLLILLLRVLPKHLMSHVAGFVASLPVPGFLRRAVYGAFCAIFGARPEDAEHPFAHYRSINAFFARSLKPGLRPVAPGCIVSPVDAAVGAAGDITDGTLWQAKGRTYSLGALLADTAWADTFKGGTYQTLYLAPRDYHRIHFPADGEVARATYVPGHLWPVNKAAVDNVDSLFAVNERIVIDQRLPGGAMAVIPVGATMVGMTRLAFDDLHTNAWRRQLDARTYQPARAVKAGDPLGHFEFGSTVILVLAPGAGRLDALPVGSRVQVGQRIGTLGVSK